MSRANEVLKLLREVRLPLDDDDIGARLDINRHYVNAICRRLAEQGLVKRSTSPTGKFVTQIAARDESASRDLMPSGSGLRGPGDRPRRRPRAERARSNVDQLIASFDECVSHFEENNAFPGPSLYFHERAIAVRRRHRSAADAVADEHLLELIYAVLPAWGMHRMGKQAAKVGDFEPFTESIRSQATTLAELWNLDIKSVPERDAPDVGAVVWEVISSLKVSTSRTSIVAGSKTLHHLLPDLVPPIDRQYTFHFFTGQMAVNHGERAAFQEWFPLLCEIGRERRRSIDRTLTRGGFMATGPAKVIDNAIMGFRQRQT